MSPQNEYETSRNQFCSVCGYFSFFSEDDLNKYTLILCITRKNAIVEYLDYQIPVTKLKGPKGDGDIQAAKWDRSAPPTHDLNIWLCGR